ncbi:hypothetical protein ACQY0O_007531 [Thecaphora frezii]
MAERRSNMVGWRWCWLVVFFLVGFVCGVHGGVRALHRPMHLSLIRREPELEPFGHFLQHYLKYPESVTERCELELQVRRLRHYHRYIGLLFELSQPGLRADEQLMTRADYDWYMANIFPKFRNPVWDEFFNLPENDPLVHPRNTRDSNPWTQWQHNMNPNLDRGFWNELINMRLKSPSQSEAEAGGSSGLEGGRSDGSDSEQSSGSDSDHSSGSDSDHSSGSEA